MILIVTYNAHEGAVKLPSFQERLLLLLLPRFRRLQPGS